MLRATCFMSRSYAKVKRDNKFILKGNGILLLWAIPPSRSRRYTWIQSLALYLWGSIIPVREPELRMVCNYDDKKWHKLQTCSLRLLLMWVLLRHSQYSYAFERGSDTISSSARQDRQAGKQIDNSRNNSRLWAGSQYYANVPIACLCPNLAPCGVMET